MTTKRATAGKINAEATETTTTQPNSDIADKPVIVTETTPEPTILEQIAAMRAKAAEGTNHPKLREGDIVAELGHNSKIVATFVVRRRGTTMVQDGTNRTIAVPLDKVTQIAPNTWTYPQATFEVNWDKVYARAPK